MTPVHFVNFVGFSSFRSRTKEKYNICIILSINNFIPYGKLLINFLLFLLFYNFCKKIDFIREWLMQEECSVILLKGIYNLIVQRNCPLLTALSNLCEKRFFFIKFAYTFNIEIFFSCGAWHEKWNIFLPYFDYDAYLLRDNKNFIRIFSIYYFASTRIDERIVERIYSIDIK